VFSKMLDPFAGQGILAKLKVLKGNTRNSSLWEF
jgi:hypothetical protein